MDKKTQEKLLDLVKNNYEEIAGEFDATRQKRLWPELFKLTAGVKDGDSILDVGCGNGRLMSAFAGKKISYLGIDNSIKLIDICKKKIEADNFQFPISNFQFKCGDILDLDKITLEKFDFIFCIAVLHHLPGRDLLLRALEQLNNRLKPGGKMILTVWNLRRQPKFIKLIIKFCLLKSIGRNKMDWGDILFDWKSGRVSRRYYHAFSKRELSRLIRRAGLAMDNCRSDKYNHYLVLSKIN